MTKPTIVVLDGHTLNPGDLTWDVLGALGTLTVHARTSAVEIISRAQGADIVLVNKVPLTEATQASLPALRYIGVLATGYNVIDTAAARRAGVVVSNVPAYGTRAVAQHTFALLLELTQHTGHLAATVRQGRWVRSPDWCYWDRPLVELAGLKLGIVGAGRIGKMVGGLGEAFGMEVRYLQRRDGPDALEALLRECDVVSLHCPLNDSSRHLINAETLRWMKPTAFLLNTSRGPLIEEAALAVALHEGRIAGAALDVLSAEPPGADNPLLSAPNVIITPHVAWAATAARRRLMDVAVDNVRAFLGGRPQNVVN